MTNYVTKNQVFKGAWAVFLVVVTVAGWSFKVFADHSSSISSLKTEMTTQIEYRNRHELIIREHSKEISDIKSDNKYMLRMVEMLLENERIPLPNRIEP